MVSCTRSVHTYWSTLFRVHQKQAVNLWRDVITLCQPELGKRLLNRNVSSSRTLARQRNDPRRTVTSPCCRRYGQMGASQEIVRVQVGKKYFRQTSIPDQCRPRLPLRNWSKALNVRPQIFMRHQHLLAQPITALGFRHEGNLPCQVKGRGHRHLEHCPYRR